MPILLFHGDNALELDEAVQVVRARFGPASTLSLDGAAIPLATLAEASRTAGLFDPERLVLVTNLHERLKGRKESGESEEIRTALHAIPASTTLLLLARDVPPDHALIRLAREAGAEVRTFVAPRKADLPRWVSRRAQGHGPGIEPGAASLLVDLVGNNPLLLERELEKLAIYTGPGSKIDRRAVESLVGAVPQDSIFTLVDAIAGGEQARALNLLHAQLSRSSGNATDVALYLIRMLARQVRILLRIRLATEAGKNRRQITSELHIPGYYAERYFQQARRLTAPRLLAAFDQLATLEHGLKSGQAQPETGLDLLVVALCA